MLKWLCVSSSCLSFIGAPPHPLQFNRHSETVDARVSHKTPTSSSSSLHTHAEGSIAGKSKEGAPVEAGPHVMSIVDEEDIVATKHEHRAVGRVGGGAEFRSGSGGGVANGSHSHSQAGASVVPAPTTASSPAHAPAVEAANMFSEDFEVAQPTIEHETGDVAGALTDNWDDAEGYYRKIAYMCV